ncbi:hypothetical protein EUGRSUZ_B01411 [Eucalyptus grandis]|uniref:Uncharacterized protein n=2 Tax=Eucalyptus grandis TaxID=71139 RepID=A0ACC3LSJ8_EUCGR|nr:hypothetical protein EUGRSUZ_B01411 [Eucalyptus grandis]
MIDRRVSKHTDLTKLNKKTPKIEFFVQLLLTLHSSDANFLDFAANRLTYGDSTGVVTSNPRYFVSRSIGNLCSVRDMSHVLKLKLFLAFLLVFEMNWPTHLVG